MTCSILNKVIKINNDKGILNSSVLERCVKRILLKTILILDINLKEKFNLVKNSKLEINEFVYSITREFIKDIIKK